MKMKISEYAKLKNVTTRTVWNWIDKGYVKVEKSESGLNQIIVDDEEVGVFNYTPEMVEELTKCKNDIVYFAEKYVHIICPEQGSVLIELFLKQKETLQKMVDSQHLIVNATRQWGGSTMNIIYLLWVTMFKDNTLSCFFTCKEETARVFMKRFKFSYDNLPNWLKAQAVSYTGNGAEFANGSQVLFKKYTENNIRGMNYDLVIFDEISFMNNFVKESLVSVLCLKNCKVFLTGTLKKSPIVKSEAWVNDLYRSSISDESIWDTIKIDWWEVPNRDEVWKNRMIAAIGEECWNEEFETEVGV